MSTQAKPTAEGNALPVVQTQLVGEPDKARPDEHLFELGVACIRGVIEAAKKYLEVVTCVRERGLSRDTVKSTLGKAGFAAARISEVWRVSQAPKEVFERFAAGVMGFKKTLDAARVAELGYETGELDFTEEAEEEKPVKASAKRLIEGAAKALVAKVVKAKRRLPYTVVIGEHRVTIAREGEVG